MLKKVDVIIVGQGISGTLLSAELLKRGKSLVVLDEEKEITSSKVSAGLYNPIVFKRVVKSWMIDDLLPVMRESYEYIETCCHQKFHTERSIIKVFVNEEEKALWIKKSNDINYDEYLEKEIITDDFNAGITPHHGLAYVKNAGSVNVAHMLEAWASYLQSIDCYQKGHMNYEDVQLTSQGVRYKNYEARFLVFCEGYQAVHNPFFRNLPFVPAKGEVLTVSIPQLNTQNAVLNKGVFVLPENNQEFRVGATYVWDQINESTTQEGLNELTLKLEKLIQIPYHIINHKAGIRPSTKDRRPLVGKHPQLPQLALLNGMGTKAVLLAPFFARALYEHLFEGKNLPPEADITRI